MGIVREPLDVDLDIKSVPWTKKELAELSEFIRKSKLKSKKKKTINKSSPKIKKQIA